MKEIMFPAGRLVGGSLYRGRNTNSKGDKLTFKDGSERLEFNFAVAFAKVPGQHWKQTAWGQVIAAEAQQAAPGICDARDFAWKVTDGDSAEANKKGKKPCDREGYPGHWVLWFQGSYQPKIYDRFGKTVIAEADAVKPGSFVQVYGNTAFNKSSESPGMYLNYTYVAYAAWGEEIELSDAPAAETLGFGQGELPPGASATPTGGMSTPPASAPAAAAQTAPPAASTAVAPAPGFLDNAPAPDAPPAGPSYAPGPKGQGKTVESMIAWVSQNPHWTPENLVKEGYLVKVN